jgi:hypothetical protein
MFIRPRPSNREAKLSNGNGYGIVQVTEGLSTRRSSARSDADGGKREGGRVSLHRRPERMDVTANLTGVYDE